MGLGRLFAASSFGGPLLVFRFLPSWQEPRFRRVRFLGRMRLGSMPGYSLAATGHLGIVDELVVIHILVGVEAMVPEGGSGRAGRLYCRVLVT